MHLNSMLQKLDISYELKVSIRMKKAFIKVQESSSSKKLNFIKEELGIKTVMVRCIGVLVSMTNYAGNAIYSKWVKKSVKTKKINCFL